jgi:hypothetical protein
MWEFLRDDLCPGLGPRWVPTSEDDVRCRRLKDLRNDVDHGNVVALVDLGMTELSSHRVTAVALLAKVYESLGSARPGWW